MPLSRETLDLEHELYSIINSQLEQIRSKDLGGRDFGNLIASLKELKKLNALDKESLWWEDLRELKAASESIEELQFGDPKKFKLIFDNGKKKEIFLQT